jgi:hypothetical protein
VWISEAVPYCLPAAFLVIEMILVLDVMGVTHIWTETVMKLATPVLAKP